MTVDSWLSATNEVAMHCCKSDISLNYPNKVDITSSGVKSAR